MTRTARCTYFRTCGSEAPSTNAHLAFFEDLSAPQDSCVVCRYTAIAHERFLGRLNDSANSGRFPRGIDAHEFVAPTTAPDHDRYYCGCRGWD